MNNEQNDFQMSDQKPYILRAVFEWLIDNGCTPHLVIAYPGKGWVRGVPPHLTEGDTLILNISPSASPDCVIKNDMIYFTTRFSGQSCSVSVDMRAVAGLVARENIQYGISWELPTAELADGPKQSDSNNNISNDIFAIQSKTDNKKAKTKGNNHLKIIK